jgi:hypothetical protein
VKKVADACNLCLIDKTKVGHGVAQLPDQTLFKFCSIQASEAHFFTGKMKSFAGGYVIRSPNSSAQ